MENDYSITIIDETIVRACFPGRPKNVHKGNFGHAFLVAGSRGMGGAALLAAKACLRSGCGLLTVQLPDVVEVPLQTFLPEAMCVADGTHIQTLLWKDTYHALGIGPGLGKHPATVDVIRSYLSIRNVSKVLDADALNVIAENGWQAELDEYCIVTPHQREFERLLGKKFDEHDRVDVAREFSIQYRTTVVLKGHETIVANRHGHVWINSTGNPGMAKGGSGDVLTGMILSFLAQGFQPEMAAKTAVFLHGRAGDLACLQLGESSVLASDIVSSIPSAFQSLKY
jgi:hydroxyethylthiazole kinase-like uncharacterized protein yjeF